MRQPAGRERETEAEVPCRARCPAGYDVPRYIRHIAREEFSEAAETLRESAPLPSVLGYVCLHPCEDGCSTTELREPVAICSLERFAMDERPMPPSLVLPPPTGRHVAVVGSGPAGLSAAWFLRRQGHDVTVFEKLDRAGGMLAVGLPGYKLPRDILHRDLKAIRDTGVKIVPGWVGPVDGVESLLDQGYDALFVATGAHRGPDLGLGDGDLLQGVDFLRDVALSGVHGAESIPGSRVVVIGGGRVAVDVARTAARVGADAVVVVCQESRDVMPAGPREVREAEEEGIRFHASWEPAEVHREAGKIAGLTVRRGNGNRVSTIETKRFPCDVLIQAAGRAPDFGVFARGEATVLDHVPGRRFLVRLERERAYAGGDLAGRTSSVVEAIASGREAAEEIGKTLGTVLDLPSPRSVPAAHRTNEAPARVRAERIDDSLRLASVEPIELTYTREKAVAEARRCLACDLRTARPGRG